MESAQFGMFPKKWRAEPISVISTLCHWIDFWSKLQKEEEQELLIKAVRAIGKVATEVFGVRRRWALWTSRLANGSC